MAAAAVTAAATWQAPLKLLGLRGPSDMPPRSFMTEDSGVRRTACGQARTCASLVGGWTWMDVDGRGSTWLGLGRTHRVGDSEEREEAEHVVSVEVS